jgi:ATP-dependent exoDNAse (exonuclease V) alpha subunit
MKNEVGCIKQYPFKLGRAITIHKAQGQTFDKMIISPEIFAAGQLYVALSRTRNEEDMHIVHDLTAYDSIISKRVVEFMSS